MIENIENQTCPCGNPQSYRLCCGLYIEKGEWAPTPEQLMRSRYTAFTQGRADYIQQTMREEALKNFNAASVKEWALSVKWDKLEVLSSSLIQESDTRGFVSFVAHYQDENKPEQIKEISEFKKIDGRWYYTNTAKMGRNDPCFCGSGKKYKKCCEASLA